MTPEKSTERSVDTLQRIYAIIVALAINEGMKRTFLKPGGSDFEFQDKHIFEFVAFLFTAIPFIHGMNRHLDKTLAIIKEDGRRILFVILVIDFAVFLIESGILFLLAVFVTTDNFFQLYIGLLTFDLLWSFVTWPITKTVVWRWMAINLAAAIGCFLVLYGWDIKDADKPAWLMIFAILRTLLDYISAWDFYFPMEVAKSPPDKPTETSDSPLT